MVVVGKAFVEMWDFSCNCNNFFSTGFGRKFKNFSTGKNGRILRDTFPQKISPQSTGVVEKFCHCEGVAERSEFFNDNACRGQAYHNLLSTTVLFGRSGGPSLHFSVI